MKMKGLVAWRGLSNLSQNEPIRNLFLIHIFGF